MSRVALHINAHQSRPLMLASVSTLAEAVLALEGGADVIDIKDAGQGSLGAADMDESRRIVVALGSHAPISATVGDLPMLPEVLSAAYRERASLGVSYVKLGLMPATTRSDCIAAVHATHEHTLTALPVAVLFADLEPLSATLITQLAQASFAGIVIDTFHKQGSLLRHISAETLKSLIEVAHQHKLFIGLAGSLSKSEVPVLANLQPNLLGFRGALCDNNHRAQSLQLARVREIREAIDTSCVALV